MAVLEKIYINNYRNIELTELEFSPNINCISGNNGEGKTNLLDAIHYLSMTKGLLCTSDKYNFKYGTSSFSIVGTYKLYNSLTSKLSIKVSVNGDKKIRKDEKLYNKIADHIGQFPVVSISPSDTSLVSDGSDERRRFLNLVLSQISRDYMFQIQQYNKLLQQRNKLLKEKTINADLLDVFNAKMSGFADYIYTQRKEFVQKLVPIVDKYYSMLSGGKEQVGIKYESDLDKNCLKDLLNACLQKDKIMQHTTMGIHRDDLVFTLNSYPIKKHGSQGQQKSFLVALKFAQYDLMKENYGFAPIFLLDDVFDKLDLGRISNLLEIVASQDFGQIFITDSNKIRMSSIVNKITQSRAYFNTINGCFTKDYDV